MLGPIPKDRMIKEDGKVDRIWTVWLQNNQDLVDHGEPPTFVTEIIAADGIAFGAHRQITSIISSTGGNTTVTANPRIAKGFDGQVGIVEGSNNTRTVTISTGNGIVLKGGSPFTITDNDVIQFHFNESKDLWIEDYRNT